MHMITKAFACSDKNGSLHKAGWIASFGVWLEIQTNRTVEWKENWREPDERSNI